MKTNIVFTGVGGQGVITAANILGKAALHSKIKVYTSEVHGMAQRGGSVYCTVRMGDVSTPLVASGTADALISTEPIEALRYIHFVNKKTRVVTDINPVVPFTVAIKGEIYPSLAEVYNEIRTYGTLYTLNALEIAQRAGSSITKNSVMLGALAALDILPFRPQVLLDTILETVPTAFKMMNKKAFNGGMNAITDHKTI